MPPKGPISQRVFLWILMAELFLVLVAIYHKTRLSQPDLVAALLVMTLMVVPNTAILALRLKSLGYKIGLGFIPILVGLASYIGLHIYFKYFQKFAPDTHYTVVFGETFGVLLYGLTLPVVIAQLALIIWCLILKPKTPKLL